MAEQEKAERTASPWEVVMFEDYDTAYIAAPDGTTIAEVTEENQDANAAFIVLACNSFDDLVKALEHARRNLVVALDVNLGDDFIPEEHVTIKEIDAALAKARP